MWLQMKGEPSWHSSSRVGGNLHSELFLFLCSAPVKPHQENSVQDWAPKYQFMANPKEAVFLPERIKYFIQGHSRGLGGSNGEKLDPDEFQVDKRKKKIRIAINLKIMIKCWKRLPRDLCGFSILTDIQISAGYVCKQLTALDLFFQ